jgi:hypothetical protein
LPCKKIQGSFVQDFEFGEDCNYKNYLQWGELKLKVAFQLGSMVDDWWNFFVKSKIRIPSWWRRDRRQISTVQR